MWPSEKHTQVYKIHYFWLVSSCQLASHLLLLQWSRAPTSLSWILVVCLPLCPVSASICSKSYLLELHLKNKARPLWSWRGGIQKFKTIDQFLRIRGSEEHARPSTSPLPKGQGPLLYWQIQGPEAEIISHHYFFIFPEGRRWILCIYHMGG